MKKLPILNTLTKIIIGCLVPILALFSGWYFFLKNSNPEVNNLRCNGLENPKELDDFNPIFTWIFHDQDKGNYQKKFRIKVDATPRGSSYWDTLLTSKNTEIKYNGKPLKSNQSYNWRIRVWDNKDTPSHSWGTGFFKMVEIKNKRKTQEFVRNKLPKEKTPKNNVFQNLINRMADKISHNSKEIISVIVGNFVYEDSKIGGSLSKYIQNEFRISLFHNKNFKIVSQSLLYKVFEKSPWQISEILDPNSGIVNTSVKESYYVLKGRYFLDINNNIKIYIGLINLQSGEEYWDSEEVSSKYLPYNIQLEPNNFNFENELVHKYDSYLASKNGSFQVKIWPDRGNTATYVEGDTLYFYFHTNKNCYIRIYHCDQNGKIENIFPYETDNNYVKAGEKRRIPSYEENFGFIVSSPYGIDKVKAIASLQQFSDNIIHDITESDFEKFKNSINRGLKRIDMKNIASSTCIYTTIPNNFKEKK